MPFFFLGILILIQQQKLAKKTEGTVIERSSMILVEKIPVILWVVLDLIIFYIDWLAGQGRIPMTGITVVTGFILHIVGALMAFFVLQKIAEKVRWKKIKWFSKLARCSMPMYLFHQQIIYFTIAWFNGRINPYINAVLNFLIALIISFLISITLMSFKYTRLLLGEK